MIFILAFLVIIVMLACTMIKPTARKGGMAVYQTDEEPDSDAMCETHAIMHLITANEELDELAYYGIEAGESNFKGDRKNNFWPGLKQLFRPDYKMRDAIATTEKQEYARNIYGTDIKPILEKINKARRDYSPAVAENIGWFGDELIHHELTLCQIFNAPHYENNIPKLFGFRRGFSPHSFTVPLYNNYKMYIKRDRGSTLDLIKNVDVLSDINFEGVLIAYRQKGGGPGHIFTMVQRVWPGEESGYIIYDDYKGHRMKPEPDKKKAINNLTYHLTFKVNFLIELQLTVIFKADKNDGYRDKLVNTIEWSEKPETTP